MVVQDTKFAGEYEYMSWEPPATHARRQHPEYPAMGRFVVKKS